MNLLISTVNNLDVTIFQEKNILEVSPCGYFCLLKYNEHVLKYRVKTLSTHLVYNT